MKYLFFIIFASSIFLISGCSSKQYFEPEVTHSTTSRTYSGTIVDLSRDGATLKNRKYIGQEGVNNIDIGEGYRFLSENNTYILASNAEGVLNIIDKKTKESVRAVSLHIPVVSAAIQNDFVVYILNNNTFGIYQIVGNKKIVESRSERTFAIDTRAASPMFIDNLAVMPMLDGKLIIVDIYNTENAKVVYISSRKAFNNIIYLARTGNTMVAATPKKVITLGDNGKQEYHANISEVAITNGIVYLFTKEGNILRLNKTLEVVAEKKFRFAHFSAATILDEKVYALDQKGSLIVLSLDLSKYKIYDIGGVEEPVFITGSKLYKDGKIIDLSKLGYE